MPEPPPGRGRFNATINDKKRPPGRTIDQRPARERRAIEIRIEGHRRAMRAAGEEVDEALATERGQAEWDGEKGRVQPAHPDRVQSLRTPDRSDEHYEFEEGVIFRSPYGQLVDERLRADNGGRPTDHIMPARVAARVMYGNDVPRPELRWKDFARRSDPVLEWLYHDPFVTTTGGRSRSAVLEALHGRVSRRTGEWVQPGIYNKEDPSFLDDLLLDVFANVRATGLFPGMGVALTLDGTKAPYALEQRQSVSRADERSLNKWFGEEIRLRRHGDHLEPWRGDLVVTLADLNTQEALGQEFVGDDEDEAGVVLRLIDRALRRLPDLDVRYLIADRGLFRRELAHALLFRYGITLVVPWRDLFSEAESKWADNFGVPYCRCDGSSKTMRYESADRFPFTEVRRELGVEPGVDIRPVLCELGRDFPRVRHRCPRCGVTEDTRPNRNALLYNYLPYLDRHLRRRSDGRFKKTDRFWARLDYLAMRNESESLNAALKLAGLWLPGPAAIRYVRTRRQAQWLARGRLLAHNVRRWAFVTGAYDALLEEAAARGYTTPGYHRGLEPS